MKNMSKLEVVASCAKLHLPAIKGSRTRTVVGRAECNTPMSQEQEMTGKDKCRDVGTGRCM
jgi:hypothetical protein